MKQRSTEIVNYLNLYCCSITLFPALQNKNLNFLTSYTSLLTYHFLFCRADSVTWNPHKLLTAPQQCSTLLLRHEGILSEAHSANAAYLFQKDKFYDTKYDTGDKHVQCGRRADVLKFWFMWKAKGTSGFEKHIDKVVVSMHLLMRC